MSVLVTLLRLLRTSQRDSVPKEAPRRRDSERQRFGLRPGEEILHRIPAGAESGRRHTGVTILYTNWDRIILRSSGDEVEELARSFERDQRPPVRSEAVLGTTDCRVHLVDRGGGLTLHMSAAAAELLRRWSEGEDCVSLEAA